MFCFCESLRTQVVLPRAYLLCSVVYFFSNKLLGLIFIRRITPALAITVVPTPATLANLATLAIAVPSSPLTFPTST